jgi:hypothetical protein
VEVVGEEEAITPLRQRRGQHQTVEPAALGRGDHRMPRTGLQPNLDAELGAEQPQIVHRKARDAPLPDLDQVRRPLRADAQDDARMRGQPGALAGGEEVRCGTGGARLRQQQQGEGDGREAIHGGLDLDWVQGLGPGVGLACREYSARGALRRGEGNGNGDQRLTFPRWRWSQ